MFKILPVREKSQIDLLEELAQCKGVGFRALLEHCRADDHADRRASADYAQGLGSAERANELMTR